MARILLVGGTGNVGSATRAALEAMGERPVVAARRPGPDGIAVDLRDPASLDAAAGFDTLLLITPLGPDESEVGVRAVERLRALGAQRFVYLAIMHLEAMRAIPHFETKIPVKQAVLADGRSTVVEANFFMTNDLMMLPAIAAGRYPLPVGSVGVQSIAPGDLGLACARALVGDAWAGRAVPACGPEALTGERLAAHWAAALGRPVRYAGDAVEPFLTGLEGRFPLDAWVRHDMARMMEVTQALGNVASEEEARQSAALIGRPPMAHAAFVRTVEVSL